MAEPATKRIRVLLVEDHEVVRTGLRLILEHQPDMEVVGEAARGDDALESVMLLQPDVAVVDISLPGFDGAELTERISRSLAPTRVVALTVHSDETYLRRALQAGASAYVLKLGPASEVCHAVRTVAAGGCYVDPRMARYLVHGYLEAARPDPARELSERERHVLRLVALGYTHREIAKRLSVSVKTVDTYRQRITEKLGFRTRADLVRYALSKGWLSDWAPLSR